MGRYLVDEFGDPITKTNPLPVELSGSNVATGVVAIGFDMRGLAAKKPAATAVPAGTTYWSVDTDPSAEAIEVSDGTKWTVM